VLALPLPPLRDRRADILPLARHFLKQTVKESENIDFDPAVQDFLMTRDYPGIFVNCVIWCCGSPSVTLDRDRLRQAQFLRRIARKHSMFYIAIGGSEEFEMRSGAPWQREPGCRI